MEALQANQRLQAVAQDLRDDGEHFPVARRAADLRPQGLDSHLVQAVAEVLHHRAVVQPVDPLDQRLARQAAGDPGLIPAGDLPAPPFRQMLGDRVMCVSQGSPPSVQ